MSTPRRGQQPASRASLARLDARLQRMADAGQQRWNARRREHNGARARAILGDPLSGRSAELLILVAVAGSSVIATETARQRSRPPAQARWSCAETPDPQRNGWGASSYHSAGDVLVGSDNNAYVSLTDNNVGNDPTTDGGTNWRAVGSAPPGDVTFSAETGPVLTDEADGHTYRLISTSGALSTELVT